MYLIIVITNIFYLLLFFIKGNSFDSFSGFVLSILYLPLGKGYETLSNWVYFVCDLMVYYIMFVVATFIFKKNENRLKLSAIAVLIADLLVVVVLTVINQKTGSSRFLRACVMFPFGLLFANYNKRIFAFIKRNKFYISIISATLATCFYTFYNSKIFEEYVISCLFAIAVISLFFNVEIESKGIDLVSKHVIYVYLSHEFFFKMLSHCVPKWNTLLVFEITLIYSVTFAIIAYKAFPKLSGIIKKFVFSLTKIIKGFITEKVKEKRVSSC